MIKQESGALPFKLREIYRVLLLLMRPNFAFTQTILHPGPVTKSNIKLRNVPSPECTFTRSKASRVGDKNVLSKSDLPGVT
jgi:hypothetical protein